MLGDGNAIQLQVYPNPVTDVLNISGADKILHIVVMDIYGRNVIDANGSGALTQNIGVKHLSEGTYMVTVKTATGNNTFKIVKQ
ncbi:MAG: T9SS type A sorting domain-containing protein [Ferruginibacter sp.]